MDLDAPFGTWTLFALLVVPALIWISPKRPLIGWQLPIIAFAICSAMTHREYPGQPLYLRTALGMPLLIWIVMLLFTLPWGLFFMRRKRQVRSARKSGVMEVMPNALALFLSAVCGFLLLIGGGMILAPDGSVWTPQGGVVAETIGIMALIAFERYVVSALRNMRDVVRLFMVGGNSSESLDGS